MKPAPALPLLPVNFFSLHVLSLITSPSAVGSTLQPCFATHSYFPEISVVRKLVLVVC
jgi:VIT1/CCC1 family predicted Fe2+/Mn2+ transporter